MAVKAPVAPAAAPYNWTGFYAGANIGGGWGSRGVDYSANDPLSGSLIIGGGLPPQSFDTSGALGGLQIGYNWQFNRNWLVGIETDFNWSGIKGSASNTTLLGGTQSVTSSADERIKWFGTVRVRAGYLPTSNLLVFVTGGFAYGQIDHSGNFANNGPLTIVGVSAPFALSCGAGFTCFTGASSDTATGWTLGGGLEYALWKNLTVKAEYLYVSLDGKSVTVTAGTLPGSLPVSYNANFDRTNLNVARLGVNYRF